MTPSPSPPSSSSGIDWEGIRHRLERLADAVERGWMPEAEERRRVLEARASALARPLAAPSGGESLEVVEFRLAGERYAFASAWVREVLFLTELTRLPCTPAFVLGIANVRGEIVSVVDLKHFFDLPRAGIGELDKLLVLHSPAMTFGVLADAIVGVRSLPLASLQAPLPTFTGPRRDYLLGVGADRLAVLDGARLLADPRLVVHETVVE